jgi:prevent-host-death family protein
MKISVTQAKGQLTELVRRAKAGDEIVLTRHGHPVVRLVPVRSTPNRQSRRALLEAVRLSGAAKAAAGPSAARSQDFSTATMGYRVDRGGYVRADGDCFR